MKLLKTRLSFAVCALGFCILPFSANAQRVMDDPRLQNWSSITSVKAYCAHLDKLIPYAHQSYMGFMGELKTTTGKENLKNAEASSHWSDFLKSRADIWGALGCNQLIYGTSQGKGR